MLRRPAVKIDAVPELEPGLQAFERRLDAIVALCSERGVRVVIATQAVLWRHGLEPAAEKLLWTADRSAYYTAAALRDAMDAFNARSSLVARKRGVELVDLAPVSGDIRWFYDDCHFTEEGARRVAWLFAERFRAGSPGGPASLALVARETAR